MGLSDNWQNLFNIIHVSKGNSTSFLIELFLLHMLYNCTLLEQQLNYMYLELCSHYLCQKEKKTAVLLFNLSENLKGNVKEKMLSSFLVFELSFSFSRIDLGLI